MVNVLQNLATEARPLNELLEKTRKWKWTDQCDAAFENIKKLVTSDQVLTHYDPALSIRLACDASPFGLGAVLSHVMPDGSERPVMFASRSLSKSERNYAQIDKETLGIVWSVRKFYNYLFARKFTHSVLMIYLGFFSYRYKHLAGRNCYVFYLTFKCSELTVNF